MPTVFPPPFFFSLCVCGLALADKTNGWQVSLEHEWRHIANHGDTVADDGTHTQAVRAAVCDYREMGLRIKLNSLQNKGKGKGSMGGITLWKLSILYRRISPTSQSAFKERESQGGDLAQPRTAVYATKGDAQKNDFCEKLSLEISNWMRESLHMTSLVYNLV